MTEQRVPVALMRASWETMTFLHWPVAPDRIQALLPSGLVVDLYDGSAWVGITPFVMANMRPLGVPDVLGRSTLVPGPRVVRQRRWSSTPETNLRTYVRGPDGLDGLWFFTLRIGSAVLAAALRAGVGAPYQGAELTVESHGVRHTYMGRQRADGQRLYDFAVEAGEEMVASDFDVWLTSRWRAYTVHFGRLLVTPVEHEPWPLRQARLAAGEQHLTESIGLQDLQDRPVVHFSDGVHKVRIGRPVLVTG